MIAPAALQAVRTVISHDNCADGLVSALLLRDALLSAEIRFVQYGTEAHKALAPSVGMLFCDFSPPAESTEAFARAGTIVLDHHRTAKPIVLAMGERGVFADEATEPGVSGALLALRHVWLPLRGESAGAATRAFAEHFATVAGVRDTWQTASPLWREAQVQSELLYTLPRAWWMARSLAQLESSWTDALVQMGEALLVKREERVKKAIAQGARFVAKGGERVVTLSGTGQTSDAAEVLGAEADLIVGFDFGVEAGTSKMRFSLRSHSDFDCAAFAAKFGGGGHTRAAGFSVVLQPSDPQPYAFVARMLG
jgi:oligoribonuclease NrnB/cAMP/cGMP phosphodiesterase (DHH superfamily)